MATMHFSCPCGKSYHVNTSFAGSAFTCTACNATMVIPAPPPRAPRPARRKGLVGELAGPILAGLAIAGVVLLLAAWWWGFLPDNPLPGWKKKFEGGAADLGENAKEAAGIGFALTVLGVGSVVALLPLLLPVVLSRRGYLSVSRWALLAVFFAVLSGIGFALGLSFSTLASAAQWVNPADHKTALTLSQACATGAAYSLVAVLGCLLAGAFYPKDDG